MTICRQHEMPIVYDCCDTPTGTPKNCPLCAAEKRIKNLELQREGLLDKIAELAND